MATKKKLPTVDIKGKEYVMVKDRILEFHRLYPEGQIKTKLLSPTSDEHIVMRATVTVGERVFNGHSQATVGDGYINKTAALENAETSAVGRALAMMGIGVIESIASSDEIVKATGSTGKNMWGGSNMSKEELKDSNDKITEQTKKDVAAGKAPF